MNRHPRIAVLSVVLLLALTFSGAFPQSAVAEDVPPPPPDTGEPAPSEPSTEPPAESPVEAPTEEPAGEVVPVASVEETEPAEVIESLPPETGLVVLDANGEPLSLTSTEAALAIATGDPMWCPAGSSPGDSDCSPSFGTFNGPGGLLNELQNTVTYTGAGTIYIAFNYTTGAEGGAIVIDGTLYALTDLTIQGGWDFGPANEVTGTTTFEEALQIINWQDDVTLNDLVFDGNSTGETENLLIETTGDIELNNVESKDNTSGDGAKLDNSAGSGTIEVNDSSFHNNVTIGIQALSNNAISLSEADSYENGLSGAVLDNCSGSPTCTATFAGTVSVTNSEFNDNGGYGLAVASNGYIYTLDITANDNTLSGAVLDNSNADAVHTVYMGYYDGNELSRNGDNGLRILSQGGITVNDVVANDNGGTSDELGAGAFIDNTYGVGNVVIHNQNAHDDTYGSFSGNFADGLDVFSNGNIQLWDVRAVDNGNTGNGLNQWGMGAYLWNCDWNVTECDGTAWVEVTDSVFDSNYSAGLWTYSGGDIDLTNVTANDNGNTGNNDPLWAVGAHLDNSDGDGGVTISEGEFGNYVTGGNYGDGLQVYSSGDVYLEYVYAYNNGQGGDAGEGNGAILDACLENATACAGTGYVYVFASEFNDNYSNGLSAFASNNIWLNYYVEAQGNGDALNVGFGTGALLVNNYTGSTGAILLYGPITLNNNVENGLIADSNGDVYMTGVDASDNDGYGAAITTTSGSVTIDPSTFSSNGEYGVLVSAAAGDVTASGMEASGNGTYGASIFSGGSVRVDLSDFDLNQVSYGLDITATDDVELNIVSASNNGTNGATISNGGGTIIADGTFDSNLLGYGLEINSSDDVTLSDISASDNATYGASISNGGNTSIDVGFFDDTTAGFGLEISSPGDVALTDISASGNTDFGADIAGGGGTTIRSGTFDGNTGDYGLHISTAGDAVVDDVSASNNATYGAFIGNGANTFVGDATFDDNGTSGLEVSSGGDLNMENVSASNNATFGALINNGEDTVIDVGYFSGNLADYGLDITSAGNVTLLNVTASSNADYGADISSGGAVTVGPGAFSDNGDFGLNVGAVEQVHLSYVQADGNAGFGADLSSSTGKIGVGGSSFSGNGSYGLDASAPGDISLWASTVNNNSGLGANLATASDIAVTDTHLDWNTGGVGLNTAANGSTTLDGVVAEENSGAGAVITSGNKTLVEWSAFLGNDAAGLSIVSGNEVRLNHVDAVANTLAGATVVTGSNVFVSPSYFTWNGANGLDILAGGGVVLAEVNASNNTGVGANVNAGGGITVNGGYFSENGGDGLNLVSGGDIIIKCITALGNGGYGIDASLPGTLKTKGNILEDNAAGDLNVSGGGTWLPSDRTCEGWPHWSTLGLPWQVIHVTSGDTHTLNCTEFGGTVLILPNWDHVAIPCPITGDASLVAAPLDTLPGELGENYTYASGLDTQVTPAFDGEIRIDFLVPPALLEKNLIILHWDGSQWVDRGGTLTGDNFFEITSREAGVFVLVSQ